MTALTGIIAWEQDMPASFWICVNVLSIVDLFTLLLGLIAAFQSHLTCIATAVKISA